MDRNEYFVKNFVLAAFMDIVVGIITHLPGQL